MKSLSPRTQWLLACGLAALVSSASIRGQTPACVDPPSDISGWWTGDLSIVDSIGGNNAVLVGSAGFGAGKVNQGFSFNGNGHLVLKASSQIDLGTAAGFTIETWINPSTVAGQRAVFEWNSGGPSGVSLYLSVIPPYGSGNGCLYANLVDTAGAAHVLTTAAGLIQENQFQHVALTYDKASGGVALYLNGALASFQLLGSFVPRTSYDLLVGYGVSSGTPAAFVGSVDEISLYRRALSQTEIANIFNAGSAGKCHAPVPPDLAPVITTQPQAVVANYGDYVTLTVAAQSTETVTYQWSRNGTAIVGATSPSLVLTAVRVGDAGQYTVAIANAIDSVTSDTAQLTVNGGPTCIAGPSGLVGWWPGEGNAADLTGANHGALSGAVEFGAGEVGLGFVLDGTSEHVTIPASSTLNVGASTGLTVEGWINPSTTSGQRAILEWNSGSAPGVQLYLSVPPPYGSGDGCLYANVTDTSNGSHTMTSGAGVVQANHFHHVALTYDKSSGLGALYLDGSLLQNRALGSFTPQTSCNLNLGYGNPGGYNFSFAGVMDEVSLYSRALAPSEIGTIFNASDAGKCRGTLPPETAPVITAQPQSVVATVGDKVTFTVAAQSIGPVTYQWRQDGTAITGATAQSLVLSSVQLSDAGQYTVAVANAIGPTVSDPAQLTVNQVPICAAVPSGLVSWWPGETGALDLTGANNGTVSGTVGYDSGEVGQALVFDGSGGHVTIPASSTLNVGTSTGLTVEGWINPSTTASQQGIVEWNSGGALGVQLYLSVPPPYGSGDGCLYANVIDTSNGYHLLASIGGVVQANRFQHVALTYDKVSGWVVFYVNGSAVQSQILGSFTPQTSYSLYLGYGQPFGSPFPFAGKIDEVSLYSRALSSLEIVSIYHASSAGKCQDSLGPPPIITQPPQSATVTAGTTVTFTVVAQGVNPLTYQWFHGTLPINEATGATLTLSNVQAADAGTYTVVVSSSGRSVSSQATLTVSSVPNTPPTLSDIPDQASDEDMPVNVTFQINDLETPVTSLAVTNISSNIDLLPPPNIAMTRNGQTVTLTLTPASDASGSTTVTVMVTDGGGLSASKSFLLVVNPVNDPPTISSVADQFTFTDSPMAPVTFTIGDVDSPIDSLTVGAASSNPTLVPDTNLIFSGAGATRTLGIQPAAGQTGTSLITVTVSDGSASTSTSFQLTVGASSPRLLRVQTAAGLSGGDVVVPIEIVALGNENALGFSLQYDPTLLGSPRVSSSLAGAQFNPNTSQAGSGRVGIGLALPIGQVISPGTHEIARVTLTIIGAADVSSVPIDFADQPIFREVSDMNALSLPATFQGGSVIVNPGYEADVAPRPGGSGTGFITVADWVQVGRFAAGLDGPLSSSEFQRADCAPRMSNGNLVLGNGAITVTDWVQAGRYAAGLDPVTLAGGSDQPLSVGGDSTSPTEPALGAISSGPSISIAGSSLVFGESSSVTIAVQSAGDVNALGLSLSFDATAVRFCSATVASGAQSALLNLNTKQVANGYLGLVLALPATQTLAAGTTPVIALSFTAVLPPPAFVPIRFADQPLPREVVDPTAQVLDSTFTDAAISIVSPIALTGNLAFGIVPVGSAPTATLTIANTGNATLTVSSISYPVGFSGAWSGTIPAGGSQPVTVTFTPTAVASYGGSLTVNCDATSDNNTLPLSGTGMAAVQCVTRDVAFWSSHVVTPPRATASCVTLTNVFNLMPGGLMNLGFLQVDLGGALGIFWGNPIGTGDVGAADDVCIARKALAKELIAAIGNVTLLNPDSSGCGVQHPQTGEFILIGTLIQQAQAATQAEPNILDCSTPSSQAAWIQEMNMLTALLNMFNGAGVTLPFPGALIDCGVGAANANYITAHDVDPTTQSNCTCAQ